MAFDLDKVIAENEEREPFTFTFDGHEYTLPPDVDLSVVDLAVDGQLAAALETVIGEEQWASIVDSPKVLGTTAATALLDAYFTHLGFEDLGELPASPRSSNRTARRSKPTSNASTTSASRRSVPKT